MTKSNRATIIVVSDSHGAKDKIDKIFNEYTFDHFIFLGDGLTDLGLYENMPNVTAVRGNCDFFSTYPYEKVINIAGKNILCTHGNTFEVKRTMLSIEKYAKMIGVDMVLFGHTHSRYNYISDGIVYLNPGSLKNGVALEIRIDNNDINYEYISI
ncbi:MAG: YfcE family phosphodiesterase [Clostridiales bacterium]|nr:YfcE family phosphodiesterase [Clostridiales bacterium]